MTEGPSRAPDAPGARGVHGEWGTDALILAVVKMAIGAWVLHQGFSHVSDDDYARTVISERFVHAPRLDPSGTSWLPLPFWIEGTAMALGGRTLGVARAVAGTLGAATVAAPYLAMRTVGMQRAAALAATAVAMALPWNAWLGVATVPEGWSGAVLAAAVIAMGHVDARPWAAAGVLVASLCRYEAWAACLVLVGLCAWSARRGGRWRREVVCATVAAVGPLAWMIWNAHAHGSPTHFLTRVATFRQTIGAAGAPLADKLFGYPRALGVDTPEVVAIGILGVVGVAVSPALQARWAWPAIAVLATFGMLVWGDVHDGAPTHHAARALAMTWWVLVAMGVDAVAKGLGRVGNGRSASTPEHLWGLSPGTMSAVACAAAACLACLVWGISLPARWADAPGRTPAERRDAQITRGLELRAEDAPDADITPCAYEHFALLAAWGAPERATIEAATHQPPGPDCPRVDTPLEGSSTTPPR